MTPEPPTTTQEPSTTTPEPTTTTQSTPTPTAPTTTPEPTTTTPEPTTTPTTERTTTTPEPPTTTQEPSTTTPEPTTTTQSTPTPTAPTTTPEPTTTTPEPSTTTPEPTTTTQSTPTPTAPTTTPEPTTTTPEPTTTPTTERTTTTPEPPTTTPEPTTTTQSTPTPTAPTTTPEPTTTSPEPTTTTQATATPTAPTTTPEPTTTTPEPTTTPTTERTTTTPEPPTTTPEPSTKTPEPTTTTQSTPTPTAPTTTPEPTTTTPEPTKTPTTERTTTTPGPPTTTPEPTTTTPEPTTTTQSTPTPTAPTTTPEPTTTTPEPTTPPTTERTTTTPEPPTTTPEPSTTTPEPPTTTPEPTTTTQSTPTPTTPTTTPEPTTTTPEPTTTTQSTPTPTEPTTTTRPTSTFSTTLLTPETGPPWTTTAPSTSHQCVCEIDGKQYETFHLCNCTMARCTDNNTIEIFPYECPPIEPITCANGRPSVLAYDGYGCCQHRVCDCVCEGWGDPHYVTFDGLYYSYQGRCTYVLMEETIRKHDLKIYIDNVYCDPTEAVSCPRSIIVSYQSQAITLKNHNLLDGAELEAFIDEQSLDLPYWKHGMKVVTTGLNLILEIPRLEVVVKFGISGFIVTLPYKNFGSNTQGHCGTCNNNQADDCKLPGGQVVGSCAEMADFWVVEDIHQPMCKTPSVVPTSKPEPPPTQSPCRNDSLCDMLHHSPFTACHPFVSPNNFYQGCVFDSCHLTNQAVECTSLQTYAAACAQAGICLHWRNTSLCGRSCPSDKVYKPCGPAEQPTCEDNANEPTMNVTTEGCFCPDGMKLFNKESGICVSKCGCLDPEGIPREFKERFEYKCQDCICDESTKTVICKPKACPAPPAVNCTGPGFVLVNQTNDSDRCCSAFVCRCDRTTCPFDDTNCAIGYKPVVYIPEGGCCPQRKCEAKSVCLHKNIEYEPGSKFPSGDCQNCTCTHEPDPKSKHLKIRCDVLPCEENCDTGYEYIYRNNGECCGKCEQTHCIFNLNGTKHVMKGGETWSPADNRCEHFVCLKTGGIFTAVNSHIVCPPFQQSNCAPKLTVCVFQKGVEKDKACKLKSVKTRISHGGCQSEEEVEVPYCEGSSANIEHSCSCCKETRFSRRIVNLKCLNGEDVEREYVHVEECGCGNTECTAAGQTPRKKRSFRLV
uniref:Mucin 2, oligomeric mucus/gel-forming n=1 Tax=Sphaeramia orbicularis TaxID=375764 RepID=A0A673CI73_9TELE